LGYPLSVDETKEQIKSVLSDENHCAFIAIENKKIVAWIHAFISVTIESKPFVEIGGLVVDENYRGKGIGNKLVDKIKEWAMNKNILSLRVRSNTKRIETHKFYTGIGFIEIKEQKVFSMELSNRKTI
jgi:ribosomal protein S18 acetylase RimI-like enzyme